MKSKKSVIKIAKWKIVLYFAGIAIGIVMSVIVILLSFRFNNNPLLNYFSGFFSSLIVTVIFAWLLERISIHEQNNKRRSYRLSWLSPIADCVQSLFYRTAAFVCTCTGEKREYRFEDFSDLLKNAFDFYCVFAEGTNNGDKVKGTIDDARRYKSEVEEDYIQFVTSEIKRVIDNEYALMADGVLSGAEISFLGGLLGASQRLNLPDLNVASNDDGNVPEMQDKTKELINDSEIKDLYFRVDLFSMALDDTMLGVEEMGLLEKTVFKPR